MSDKPDYDVLIQLAPNTALAIAAGLPTVPPAIEVARCLTGLTEGELLCGYGGQA